MILRTSVINSSRSTPRQPAHPSRQAMMTATMPVCALAMSRVISSVRRLVCHPDRADLRQALECQVRHLVA